jgi:hypothetical protein
MNLSRPAPAWPIICACPFQQHARNSRYGLLPVEPCLSREAPPIHHRAGPFPRLAGQRKSCRRSEPRASRWSEIGRGAAPQTHAVAIARGAASVLAVPSMVGWAGDGAFSFAAGIAPSASYFSTAPILFGLALHRWRLRVLALEPIGILLTTTRTKGHAAICNRDSRSWPRGRIGFVTLLPAFVARVAASLALRRRRGRPGRRGHGLPL